MNTAVPMRICSRSKRAVKAAREGKVEMRAKPYILFVLLFVLWLVKPHLYVAAQTSPVNSWKSFELVYYDPAAKPHTLSPFNVDPRSEFTTEMRIEYLRR